MISQGTREGAMKTKQNSNVICYEAKLIEDKWNRTTQIHCALTLYGTHLHTANIELH